MSRLIAHLFEICLLRRGPQDLPFNAQLALVCLAALAAVELLTAYAAAESMRLAVPVILTSTVFSLVAVRLVLRWAGNEPRFWQTLLALAGTGLLFAAVASPLRIALGPIDPAMVEGRAPMPPGFIIVALLGFWRLIVMGHIWRHALDTRLPIGVLVAIGLFLVETVLTLLLFAPASNTASTAAAS